MFCRPASTPPLLLGSRSFRIQRPDVHPRADYTAPRVLKPKNDSRTALVRHAPCDRRRGRSSVSARADVGSTINSRPDVPVQRAAVLPDNVNGRGRSPDLPPCGMSNDDTSAVCGVQPCGQLRAWATALPSCINVASPGRMQASWPTHSFRGPTIPVSACLRSSSRERQGAGEDTRAA
jgi:hypothetical protein